MQVAMVGWRGMVGSVLLDRMDREGDFEGLQITWCTTSQVGETTPERLPVSTSSSLSDAHDLDLLAAQDVVVTCQGGSYTEKVYADLRGRGWRGWWIDAASTLRLSDDAVVVLDPVNRDRIERRIDQGVRTLVGGNCTVSLMLMAIAPLFGKGWIEWLSSMTYQAASGAGAAALRELAEQTRRMGEGFAAVLNEPAAAALELDRSSVAVQRDPDLPTAVLGAPLEANLIPWIDRSMPDGRTREEWKGEVETQAILDLEAPVPVDGLCVRVGAMRCHAQALTIKLKRPVPVEEIEDALSGAHDWIELVPNTPEETRRALHPAAISGGLKVAVGRLRTLRMGPEYLTAFTVGDQLLWGAAEPLRRALALVRGRL